MQRPNRLQPNEPIPQLKGLTVADFWSWAYSDILSNVNRSIFAEFLVGSALAALDRLRVEWNGYDLLYRDKKIEVKSSGFLQSWKQTKLSKVSFDIASKNPWDAETNTYAGESHRSSDCYVFCLYTECDPAQANVLNVDGWEFYVVTTERLNTAFDQQKSVALSRMQKLCNPVKYDGIKPSVDRLLF